MSNDFFTHSMNSSKATNYPVILFIWGINLLLVIATLLFLLPGKDAQEKSSSSVFSSTSSLESYKDIENNILLMNPVDAVESENDSLQPSSFLTTTPFLPEKMTLTPTTTPTITAIPIKMEISPTLEFPFAIGYSVQGKAIEVYTFGSGKIGRIIIAGIHGGYENNTIILVDQIIADIMNGDISIPPDITLYILRSLNPDGEYIGFSSYARSNANNVDLNRNWGVNWQAELDTAGCWNNLILSPGSEPFSEPETQALKSFLEKHSEIDALISYHSAYLGIFPGGIPPDKNSIFLAESIASVSPYPYPPIDTGCPYTGQLIDWASSIGIAALDVELNSHIDSEHEINQNVVYSFLNWRKPDINQ